VEKLELDAATGTPFDLTEAHCFPISVVATFSVLP
jgi:hypothetical protein